ncbi:MAG: zinc carboxypeptidase, partial [Bacteroidota bacterium]
MRNFCLLFLLTGALLSTLPLRAQDYFLKTYEPYNPEIPSPEEFLGYPIGQQHTRHDLMVAYFQKLAELSDRASLEVYGQSHEHRKLVMLTISSKENLDKLPAWQEAHLKFVDPEQDVSNYEEVPIFVQLGYNVHG